MLHHTPIDSSIDNKKATKIDSLQISTTNKWANHSPKKAAYHSLMIPGWGQYYNKQPWKIPFVYGALAGVVLGYRWNNLRYQDFKQVYIDSYITSTGTFKPSSDVYVRSQSITRNLTIDQITKAKDFYRRNRDLNIFIFVGVWVLNAVEANVTAHLRTFDDSDDLSFHIKPYYEQNRMIGSTFGTSIILNFNK